MQNVEVPFAETFGKEHYHVLEAIEAKISSPENSAQLPKIGSSKLSHEGDLRPQIVQRKIPLNNSAERCAQFCTDVYSDSC